MMTASSVKAEVPRMRANDCGEAGCITDPHAGEWFELGAKKQSGCLVVHKAKAREERQLVLAKCGEDAENIWRYNNGLFHSRLNDTMCMQAGRKPKASSGRRMRLFPCDRQNPNQVFQYFQTTGHITLQSDRTLCIEFEGRKAQVDDAIVLKTCEDAVDGWTRTYLNKKDADT